MADNKIQIKRSATNVTIPTLSNGELAFTGNGDILYIGHPDGTTGNIRIGGKQNPGVLTANQALVANASSEIDKVIVANLVPTRVWANGAAGSDGQYLTSNSSGGVYWQTPSTGVAGSNTQIQFNDSGSLAGDAGLTYDKTTDTLSSDKIAVVNTAASSNTTTGALTVAGGVGVAGRINVNDIAIGNDSVYTSVNNSVIAGNNVFATGTVNGSVVQVGTSIVANSSQLTLGTGVGFSVNGSLGSAGEILYSNGSSSYWAAAPTGDITDVTAGDGLTGGGSSGSVTLDVGAGDGISVNASAVSVLANNGLSANATGVFVKPGVDGGLSANSTGVWIEAGDGLSTNATGLHVGAGDGVSVNASSVSVKANNGIFANASGIFVDGANGISVDGSGVNVQAGTNGGLSVNSSGVWVVGGTGVTVNSTGVSIGQDVSTSSNVSFANVVTTDLTVNGNTVVGSNSSDVVAINAAVNTNLMPAANVTYSIGNNTIRWNEIHASNVHSVTGYFDGNVEVSGDLIVTGNVTTTNVNSVVVSDPMIYLAANNYLSDLLDIGFAGNYYDGSTQRHTGLFRDATDGNYKLFTNSTQELSGNNVVNTSAIGYTTASLEAYLLSSGLTTNAGSVAITANSTVNVAIVANTLTLSSALPANSGGTGQSSYTTGDLLYASNTSYLSKLAVPVSAANGQVLQIVNNMPAYDTLDGGTF